MEFKAYFSRIKNGISEIGNDWFSPDYPYWKGKLDYFWIVILYIIGFIQWGNFFSWGQIDFRTGDWYDITGPRLNLIKDAASRLILPLHISNPVGLKGVTDRILSIPDIFISPQFFLLRFLDPGLFVLVNTLLFFTIGFVGLIWLCKRLKLSKAVGVVLFFLFNFNGHITAHLSCGHITWMGYFLLPYFILLILQRPHPGVQWRWILKVSLLSVAFYLQGSYHLWNWCILFLIFLGLFATDYRKNSFLAIIFSLLINSFRIVPVSLINSDLQVDFLTGFLNMDELFNSLIRLVQPSDALALTNNKISHYIVWWEVDHYIGWMGLFFILVFGGLFWYWVRKKVKNPFLLLYMPILCMVVISVGRIFKPVFLLHIPLLDAERVPSRFLIIPLLFLFVISAYGLQTYFDRFPINIYSRVIYFASLLWLVNDLQQHFELWSVVNANQAFLPAVEKAIFDTINNHPDPVYFTSLISGLVLSMAVLIFLVERTHRENKKNSLHPHQEMDCFENRPMP